MEGFLASFYYQSHFLQDVAKFKTDLQWPGKAHVHSLWLNGLQITIDTFGKFRAYYRSVRVVRRADKSIICNLTYTNKRYTEIRFKQVSVVITSKIDFLLAYFCTIYNIQA